MDQLASLIDSEALKALCESGKANAVWCQYKQLLELNGAYEQHQKSVQKKSAGDLCLPGLPLSCRGFLPSRVDRAAEKEAISENDRYPTENDDDFETGSHETGSHDGVVDSARAIDSGMGTKLEYENDSEDAKRAMKCRPGMINCRRRRKKGKRTLAASSTPKHCPQGWMFCV